MANLISVSSLLPISIIHEFSSTLIDFVPALTQADLDVDIFMELPLLMVVDGNRIEWVLNLNKSLYGLKQSSANWFDFLATGIERKGYHQSQVDPCLFTKKKQLFYPMLSIV